MPCHLDASSSLISFIKSSQHNQDDPSHPPSLDLSTVDSPSHSSSSHSPSSPVTPVASSSPVTPFSLSHFIQQPPLPEASVRAWIPLKPFPTVSTTASPLQKTEAEKRKERQIKNRQAAEASRKRKREHVQQLESLTDQLTKENQELSCQLKQSRAHIQSLSDHIHLLESTLAQVQFMVASDQCTLQHISGFLSSWTYSLSNACKDPTWSGTTVLDMERGSEVLTADCHSTEHLMPLESLVHTELLHDPEPVESLESTKKTRLHSIVWAFFFCLALFLFPFATPTLENNPGKQLLVRPSKEDMGLTTRPRVTSLTLPCRDILIPSKRAKKPLFNLHQPRQIHSLALANVSHSILSFIHQGGMGGIVTMASVLKNPPRNPTQSSPFPLESTSVHHLLQDWSATQAKGVYMMPSYKIPWQCSPSPVVESDKALKVYQDTLESPANPSFSMVASMEKPHVPSLYLKLELSVTRACVIEL